MLSILLINSLQESESVETPLSLSDVNALMDELAALSPYTHHTIRDRFPKHLRRSRRQVLQSLYRCLSPTDAAVITQILLKDLRPSMYPLPEEHLHFTSALKQGRSNDVHALTIEDAFRAWDPSGNMNRGWYLMGLDGAVDTYDTGDIPAVIVGNPIQVSAHSLFMSCQPLEHASPRSLKLGKDRVALML